MSAELTVNKGIFEFRTAPDTTLVLLRVLVRLPVAVLFERRPEVERVDDVVPVPALLLLLLLEPGLVPGHLVTTVEAVKGLRGDDVRGDAASVGLHVGGGRGQADGALVARDDAAAKALWYMTVRSLAERESACGVDMQVPTGIGSVDIVRCWRVSCLLL